MWRWTKNGKLEKGIANNINKNFCEVGKKLSYKINIPDNSCKKLPERNNKWILIKPITVIEVLKTIN